MVLQLFQRLPHPNTQSGHVGRTQGGDFRNRRTYDLRPEYVGLELHHEVIARSPAVDLQLGNEYSGIPFHGRHHIHGLEGYALKGGPGYMGGGHPQRQADYGAARIRIPVRGSHARQCRNEIHSSAVRNRSGQILDFRRVPDDAETVPEPADHRSGDEDAAFEGIIHPVPYFPRDRGQQAVLGEHGLVAAVHEKETAGAVGVLHRPLLHAHLSEERRLLVADDARNRDAAALYLGLAYDSGGVADHRHHGLGDAEEIQQLAVPLQGVDVEEHGPGGVGDVGHMHLAPSEVPDQPGIHGAEAQPSRAGLGHRAGDVV